MWWCGGGREITEVRTTRETESREEAGDGVGRSVMEEKEKRSGRKNHGHGVDRALNPDPTGVLRRSTTSLRIGSSTLLGLPHYQPCCFSTLSFFLSYFVNNQPCRPSGRTHSPRSSSFNTLNGNLTENSGEPSRSRDRVAPKTEILGDQL